MSGDPHLILLPGLLCNRNLWVYALDNLQHLAEMRVPDLTRQDSLAAMARHVLDQAPPRFALAGLSMGGYLAFELWRQAPQRIERLAFVNT